MIGLLLCPSGLPRAAVGSQQSNLSGASTGMSGSVRPVSAGRMTPVGEFDG